MGEAITDVWSRTCLAGAVAVVSGASSGIGAAVAGALAAVGARTFGLSRDPVPREDVVMLRADAGNEADVRAAVAEIVAREGRVDIAVANAASWTGSPFEEFSREAWDDELRLNLTGPFVLFQSVVPTMRAAGRGGSLIAVGLTAGERGASPHHVAYGASKAGVQGLCKSLARDLGPDRILVKVLALGTIDGTLQSEELKAVGKESYGRSGPLNRAGTVTEAAHGAVFLASPASSFVTGSVLRVDGGALYSQPAL